MLYEIIITMDNDAFHQGMDNSELCRILETIKSEARQNNEPPNMELRDINGNRCGSARLVKWDNADKEVD